MFRGCTNLNSVTCLATDISAGNCLYSWLKNAGTDASISVRKLHVKSGQTGTGWDWKVPSTWTVVDDQ